MGKLKKNIKRNQKEKNEKKLNKIKREMIQQMNSDNWNEALALLAELIENGCRDPEVYYLGAKIYYMLGDLERSAKWVDNTLRFMPAHVEARLLLAKLCLLNDRLDDAMAIYTVLLKNYINKITDEQKKEICASIDVALIDEDDWLQKEYPLVYQLYTGKHIKEKTFDDEKEDCYEPNIHNEDEVMKILEAVNKQNISLAQKVKTLNVFAAGFYTDRDFVNSEKLLTEALRIDESDVPSIRNLAVLYGETGNKDKAMQLVTKLPYTDFMLLHELMKM